MRKILIGILIILLVIMAYFAIAQGISIGNFKILSVQEIKEANDNLTVGIQEIQTLMFTDYPSKTDELDKNVSSLLEAKNEYLDLASVSTEGELSKANKEEIYTYEYLWTRIGRHATAEGVLLKLDFYAGDTGEADVKTLNYTVTGHYIAIINFIESIEEDSKLGFRIENFKMVPGGENLQATFVTRNIRIKPESTNSNVSTNSNTATTPENTNEAQSLDNGTNTAQ